MHSPPSQLLFLIVASSRAEAAAPPRREKRGTSASPEGGSAKRREDAGQERESETEMKRWREKKRSIQREEDDYTPAAPAVEVVRALLVACSRTYTLDRTFDLGSRGIADDLGPYVTGYVEREARASPRRTKPRIEPGKRFWEARRLAGFLSNFRVFSGLTRFVSIGND